MNKKLKPCEALEKTEIHKFFTGNNACNNFSMCPKYYQMHNQQHRIKHLILKKAKNNLKLYRTNKDKLDYFHSFIKDNNLFKFTLDTNYSRLVIYNLEDKDCFEFKLPIYFLKVLNTFQLNPMMLFSIFINLFSPRK